jgi:hypothetical protein
MGMSELASSSGVSSLIKKQDNLIRSTANKTVRREGISMYLLVFSFQESHLFFASS